MKLFPCVLAGISLGVLAFTLAVALVASVVPVTGRIIMSLLGMGELLGSLQSKISRHRDRLRALFDDLCPLYSYQVGFTHPTTPTPSSEHPDIFLATDH